VIIQLTRSFLGSQDPKLTASLVTELPGILNWALDGLERIAATDTITEPKSSFDAKLALQDLVSPVPAFVREQCEIDATSDVTVDTIYSAWKSWAEDNGHRATSKHTFGRDLRAVVPGLRMDQPRKDGGTRQRRYVGVRLTTGSQCT